VQAASMGFTILMLGGLAALLAAAMLPAVGRFWLAGVAVVAFAIAGSRIGMASSPLLHGACAAVGAYVLALSVVFFTTGLQLDHVLTTTAAAVDIGAATGHLCGRFAMARRPRTARSR